MFFPDFPGPKSTAVLGIQNFSWVKAFHLWKASTYQAGATFFSFLTPLQKEKVWKIDWFWQIFTWIADGSNYLKAYIALQTSKSWLKAYGCSDLITLCLWAFCLILRYHQSTLSQAKQTIFFVHRNDLFWLNFPKGSVWHDSQHRIFLHSNWHLVKSKAVDSRVL